MKPILFNTDMVRAILAGRKTVTRRVIKGQDKNTMYAGSCLFGAGLFDNKTHQRVIESPYKVGDVLYIRETWREFIVPVGEPKEYGYKADIDKRAVGLFKWKPSIHMPKEAARIFLKVTSVKAALLRDMELEDFLKEGIYINRSEVLPTGSNNMLTGSERQAVIDCRREAVAREKFKDLWNSTAGKPYTPERYANNWYGNPYVWVIEFEVIPADQAEGN